MERRRESRQSSLPSSLIPHLYTGPQGDADGSNTASFGVTLPLPASAVINEGTSLTERVSSLTLPPLVPPFSASSTREGSRHSPQYAAYGSISPVSTEHLMSTRAPSPAERSSSAAISRSLASLSIPPHHGYNPIYSDPMYHAPRTQTYSHRPGGTYSLPVSQDIGSYRGGWREGEAGPSSLVYPIGRPEQRSRGSSQPADRTLDLDTSETYHIGESRSRRDHRPVGEGRHEGARSAILPELVYDTQSEQFHATSRQVPNVGSETSSPHLPGRTSHSPYTLRSAGSSDAHSPSPFTEVAVEPQADNDVGDVYSSRQKGKKRRRDSDQGEESSRKNQTTRKTAVACNFCRGRKLRCNGAKPSCQNCTVRKFQCEYVPVQRRRGPGKAPKGTKSKKGPNASRSQPSTTLPPIDNLSSHSIQETRLPEYLSLPQTSVISLDNFSFQPPDPSPRYPSPLRSGGRASHSAPVGPEVDPDTDKEY